MLQLSGKDRRRTVIHRFEANSQAQVGEFASFDGRYLAYPVTWSYRDLNDWTLYVWDSKTGGAPKEIARSVKGPDGAPAPGPWNYVVAYDGKVAWTQGTGEGDAAVHVYSIAEQRDTVVRRGQASYPIRMGSWLVWPESPTEGAPSKLQAVDLKTEKPVELPKVMADITGPNAIFADDTTLVWSNSTWTELSVWRTDWPEPVVAVTSSVSRALQRVHVTGDIVTWDNAEAQFALDLRSGGYAQITPEWGSNNSWGKVLRIGFAPASKTSGSDQVVLRADRLPPPPACP